MNPVGFIKRQLHHDICRDPVLHGLVLNFYLNGEEYPDRVADYFPVAQLNEPEIAELLAAHLADERKHVALYSKALCRIGQTRMRLPIPEIYNTVILQQTVPVRQGSDHSADLAGFFAHLHFLETRIARSLEMHLDACAHASSPYPSAAVAVVLEDEIRHARYTREVISNLVPRARVREILAHHRKAEARANRIFSGRQLEMLTREYSDRFPRVRRLIYRSAALIQQWSCHDN